MESNDDDLYRQHHRTRRSPMMGHVEDDTMPSFRQSHDGSDDENHASSSLDDNELYAVLGVSKDATEEQIKKAYKFLVQTMHPDKIRDESRKRVAQEKFIAIQQAYDVLKDVNLRNVYDVYGMEGLEAGMQVSEFVDTASKHREWMKFQEHLKKKQIEEAMMSQQQGLYIFKTDATSLVSPYAKDLPRMPQVTNVYMSTGIDIPIETGNEDWLGILGSQQDSLHVGGMVTARDGHGGGGSFVAGYHRFYSSGAQVGVEGSVGLQTLLGIQCSIPLSHYFDNSSLDDSNAHAGIFATGGCSWSPESGVTCDVGTSCQLGQNTSGEFGWTVYPLDMSSISFTIKHKMFSWLFLAKAEIGAVTSLTLRAIRQLSDVLSGRLSFKASVTQGIELEVGGHQKLSDTSVAGMGVVTGLPAGVLLRLRFQKSGHTFEFPVALSPTLDPWIVFGAYVVPPTVLFTVLHGIIRPIHARFLGEKAARDRERQSKTIRQELQSSQESIDVIRPVALRKMEKESKKNGLVIVKALYGKTILLSDIQPETLNFNINTPEDVLHEEMAVIDVTIPIQYMCDTDRSEVVFYSGYSKSKLLGFFDPCPGQEKTLVVLFFYQGVWLQSTLGDSEGGRIPTSGIHKEIEDPQLVAALSNLLPSMITEENPLFEES
jgi:DnaJ homolog subfamily C member 11